MRLLTALLIVLALPPATAAAAPLEPVAPLVLDGRSPAACVRATGAPGEVAALAPRPARRAAMDVLAAGASGLAPVQRLPLGGFLACPAVAGAADGTGVVAVAGRRSVRVAVRDPGGAFGPAVRVAATADAVLAAAAARGGHAAVAWVEHAESATIRLRVARRLPGAAFGPPETVSRMEGGLGVPLPEATVGVDASGTVTVAWTPLARSRKRHTGALEVEVATGAAGAPFRRARPGVDAGFSAAPALAVAPDGRALLAVEGADALRILERAPGAPGFAAVDAGDLRGVLPAVALREDGAAVVAWRGAGRHDTDRRSVLTVTRDGAGAFGTVQRIAPRAAGGGSGVVLFLEPAGFPPAAVRVDTPSVALDAEGRVLVAWTAAGGTEPRRAHAAQGTLGGPAQAPERLGAPVRPTTGVAAVLPPGAPAAVAWGEDAAGVHRRGADGRLRLAVAGAVPLGEPAPPRVRVTAARRQELYAAEPSELTVRCSAACDVRARVPGKLGEAGGSLARAGRLRLRVPSVAIGRQPARQRVLIEATAPGGDAVTRITRTIVRVHRRPLPVPRPEVVRAVRRGDRVVMSWRTERPARRALFGVALAAGRQPPLVPRTVAGNGRTRFRVTLRTPPGPAPRSASVQAYSVDGGPSSRTVRVPVR